MSEDHRMEILNEKDEKDIQQTSFLNKKRLLQKAVSYQNKNFENNEKYLLKEIAPHVNEITDLVKLDNEYKNLKNAMAKDNIKKFNAAADVLQIKNPFPEKLFKLQKAVAVEKNIGGLKKINVLENKTLVDGTIIKPANMGFVLTKITTNQMVNKCLFALKFLSQNVNFRVTPQSILETKHKRTVIIQGYDERNPLSEKQTIVYTSLDFLNAFEIKNFELFSELKGKSTYNFERSVRFVNKGKAYCNIEEDDFKQEEFKTNPTHVVVVGDFEYCLLHWTATGISLILDETNIKQIYCDSTVNPSEISFRWDKYSTIFPNILNLDKNKSWRSQLEENFPYIKSDEHIQLEKIINSDNHYNIESNDRVVTVHIRSHPTSYVSFDYSITNKKDQEIVMRTEIKIDAAVGVSDMGLELFKNTIYDLGSFEYAIFLKNISEIEQSNDLSIKFNGLFLSTSPPNIILDDIVFLTSIGPYIKYLNRIHQKFSKFFLLMRYLDPAKTNLPKLNNIKKKVGQIIIMCQNAKQIENLFKIDMEKLKFIFTKFKNNYVNSFLNFGIGKLGDLFAVFLTSVLSIDQEPFYNYFTVLIALAGDCIPHWYPASWIVNLGIRDANKILGIKNNLKEMKPFDINNLKTILLEMNDVLISSENKHQRRIDKKEMEISALKKQINEEVNTSVKQYYEEEYRDKLANVEFENKKKMEELGNIEAYGDMTTEILTQSSEAKSIEEVTDIIAEAFKKWDKKIGGGITLAQLRRTMIEQMKIKLPEISMEEEIRQSNKKAKM